jgi:hypothetical protein
MKIAKRYLAVVLSFALFLALPLAFTQEAAAASKTKILQPSLVIESYNYFDGTTGTSVEAYAYSDKGLMSARVYQSGAQDVFMYNKSGYMTSETSLNSKGVPYYQTMYDVKKGKIKGITNFYIDGAKVSLQNVSKISYKKGKLSQVVFATADGKTSEIATYKSGVLSRVVRVSPSGQTAALYDKYGNKTSMTQTYNWGSFTETDTTVYKNTYKSGKLVKVAWARTESYSNSTETDTATGLTVYTYKKGKLVKKDSATNYSYIPGVTYGSTSTYAYTKGGLISTISSASVQTTATESKITSGDTTAYQYKKVAVNSKYVKAVKEAMEDYGYENFLPGNDYYPGKGLYS